MNPSGGGGVEGEFASVEDAFLAGFEAWGELGQMQGSLLGTGPGQASGKAASTSDASHNTGNGGTVGGAGGAGEMTYRSGLGGSVQSFLGEAGIYADNSNGLGPDSFKDGFDWSGKDFIGCAGGSSTGSTNTIRNSNASNKPSEARTNKQQDVASCKMESMDDMDGDAENEHDANDSEGDDDEHDYLEEQDELDIGEGPSGSRGAALRGLGRIFGMGTHPVVAEAQARAEALVHGRGGKCGGTGKSAADAAEKKRKRAVLSKEERAKQNRDRNREHARNTRLRKKAFVEELKKQLYLQLFTKAFRPTRGRHQQAVEELVANREREERERRAESRRDSSLKDIRVQVLLTFLEYRGRGETSRQAWQSVLDEQFEMRMPLTPYRTFPPHQVQGGIRVIKGVEGVVGDTLSLAMATRGSTLLVGRPNRQDGKATPSLQLQAGRNKGKAKGSDNTCPGGGGRVKRETASSSTSGSARLAPSRIVGATTTEPYSGSEASPRAVGGGKVGGRGGVTAAIPTRVYYLVDPKEVMANKNAFMCPFVARSSQILVPGMLRCTFSMKSNRLSSLHLSFDPTVPAKQLQLARANLSGRSTHDMTSLMMSVVPTPQPAMADEGMGSQVQSSSSVSAGGSSSSGGRQQDGQVQEQGSHGQDEGVLKSVLEDIRAWRVSSTLVDDPHEGKSYLRVYPLNGDTPGVTHFIGVLESLAASQGADTLGGVSPVLDSPRETVVSNAIHNLDTTGDAGTVDFDGRVTVGGHSKAEVGEESSSQRENVTSEGETSSDSTGSRGRQANDSNDATTYNTTVSRSGGEISSGSGGSDYGTATSSRSGRLSRSFSATTTAASDGSSASGCETRRSARRLAAPIPTPDPATPGTTTTTVGRPGVAIAGGGTRVRVRSEGCKRGRA